MNAIANVVERPILFSGEMVRALLAGRKTQTRRVIKPQPVHRVVQGLGGVTIGMAPALDGAVWYDADGMNPGREMRCPYGRIGDRLWVREAWTADCDIAGQAFEDGPLWWHEVPASLRGLKAVDYVLYRADGAVLHAPHPDPETGYVGTPAQRASDWRPTEEDRGELRWQPSIHMPRWASRLTLEITDVRVQRVQSISDWDCWDEGISEDDFNEAEHYLIGGVRLRGGSPERCVFSALWDSINAVRGFSWTTNPWTWALTFRVVEGA